MEPKMPNAAECSILGIRNRQKSTGNWKEGTATLHWTTEVHKGELVINLKPSAK